MTVTKNEKNQKVVYISKYASMSQRARSQKANAVIRALKERSKHNATVLGLLEYDWPVANLIIENISNYVGCTAKTGGKPVIYEILEFALERYSKFVFHSRKNKYDDALRIAAFIEGLIAKTCQTVKAKITCKTGEHSWSTLSDIPFTAWCDRHNTEGLKVEPEPIESELDLRKFIYDLITNEQVKHILRNTNYEQAVVLGSLGASH